MNICSAANLKFKVKFIQAAPVFHIDVHCCLKTAFKVLISQV